MIGLGASLHALPLRVITLSDMLSWRVSALSLPMNLQFPEHIATVSRLDRDAVRQ